MPYRVAIAIIIGCTVLGGLATWLVHRTVRLDLRRRHHEVGSAVFLQLGVLFAVLLAFVFNEVWSEYNIAAEAINLECGNLLGAATVAEALPAEPRQRLLGAISRYLRSVIEDEWPEMARRRESRRASEEFRGMWQKALTVDAEGMVESTARRELLSELQAAHRQRATRLYQMTSGIPSMLWTLLVMFSAVLVFFVLFSGMEYLASQILFSGLFTGALAFILVLLRLLDFPFEGALRISPEGFQDALAKVLRLAGS